MSQKIIYTAVDEAPALATYSLLPIIQKFAKEADIEIVTKDISLAGRVIAQFPQKLTDNQKIANDLTELGKLTQDPNTNIIKLPNISASIPQLKKAIAELQEKGYDIPSFPENIKTEEDKKIRQHYSVVLGSAVNPVLREGNSDRRAPKSVKNYAKKHPHSMGKWIQDSKTHVATMKEGNFKTNEQSVTINEDLQVEISYYDQQGNKTILKDLVNLKKGEIVDATFMSKQKLIDFLKSEIKDAKEKGILFSLHMKATMMKISDPIIFGYAVEVFFEELFKKYQDDFLQIGVDPSNGFSDLYNKIESLSPEKQSQIKKDIDDIYNMRPDVAMVNSDKGITNLHYPNDIIIDASMPAMIRAGGKMWNKKGEMQDVKAVIPDSSYAPLYDETIKHCKKYGAFDPTTMGTVQNVGLMAKKAEEYGSHDTTFKVLGNGMIKILNKTNGDIILENHVQEGDIWRMVMAKDESIRDWVKLAVNRSRHANIPVVFWLDDERAHDRELKKKVELYLKDHDTKGIDIEIMSVAQATAYSLERAREGKDTISATGNVLRDYNTDLFPILELGTSAKMLSIVPLMKGGGLFETGAGGSAPKHVQQLLEENHLRWDSLGEFLALAASLEHLATLTGNKKAQILSETLDKATGKLLNNNQSPKRKCKELDNRGSHFYLTKYWAEFLAQQDKDLSLKNTFSKISQAINDNEEKIISDINSVQGTNVEIGGYYRPDTQKAKAIMRPSEIFNQIIDNM